MASQIKKPGMPLDSEFYTYFFPLNILKSLKSSPKENGAELSRIFISPTKYNS